MPKRDVTETACLSLAGEYALNVILGVQPKILVWEPPEDLLNYNGRALLRVLPHDESSVQWIEGLGFPPDEFLPGSSIVATFEFGSRLEYDAATFKSEWSMHRATTQSLTKFKQEHEIPLGSSVWGLEILNIRLLNTPVYDLLTEAGHCEIIEPETALHLALFKKALDSDTTHVPEEWGDIRERVCAAYATP